MPMAPHLCQVLPRIIQVLVALDADQDQPVVRQRVGQYLEADHLGGEEHGAGLVALVLASAEEEVVGRRCGVVRGREGRIGRLDRVGG